MRQLSSLKQKLSFSRLGYGLKRTVKISLILATGLLTSCSDYQYNSLEIGKLKGRLIIEWINKDVFRFIKHNTDPLQFTRHDGTTIVPDTMVTDGGTVPAPLRAVKTYSPWGFGPAFVIHDWLFQMKSCKLPGHEDLTFEASADIMAEIIKTMMESKEYGDPDKLTLYSLHTAVKSRYAKDMWENGVCVPVPARAVIRKRMPTAPDATPDSAPAAPDEGEQKPMEYSGEQAKRYKRKMEVMKKAIAAPSKFTFEQSYNY